MIGLNAVPPYRMEAVQAAKARDLGIAPGNCLLACEKPLLRAGQHSQIRLDLQAN